MGYFQLMVKKHIYDEKRDEYYVPDELQCEEVKCINEAWLDGLCEEHWKEVEDIIKNNYLNTD